MMKYYLIKQYKFMISALGISKINFKNKVKKPRVKLRNIKIHTLAPGLIFKNKIGKEIKVQDCFFNIK